MHRRSPAQRWAAARYDGAHALLVRLVHPLCFAAFALAVTAVGGTIAYGLLSALDEASGALAVAVVAASSLAAGFKFVATPGSAAIAVIALAGWAVALIVVDDVPDGLMWLLVAVATLSILIQLVLLVRAVPDRWHNGLMHLLWPSALGTLLGAAPVAALVLFMFDDRREDARLAAAAAFAGGCIVVVVLIGWMIVARRGDRGVLADFANRHALTAGSLGDDARLIAPLAPKFGAATPLWAGPVADRRVAAVTGCTASWAPDLPSLHLTVLGIDMGTPGRDVWVRRRAWSHDNVLASLGRSEVVRFESIRLSEEFTVRFAAGTDELTAFRTIGPELVALLSEELGAAQVCRIGSTLLLFIVGGALDADELDGMLDAGMRIADLLERGDRATA